MNIFNKWISVLFNKWIPVKDKLPIVNNKYHTRYFFVKFPNHKYVHIYNFDGKRFTNLDTYNDFDNEASHWKEIKMPNK